MNFLVSKNNKIKTRQLEKQSVHYSVIIQLNQYYQKFSNTTQQTRLPDYSIILSFIITKQNFMQHFVLFSPQKEQKTIQKPQITCHSK